MNVRPSILCPVDYSDASGGALRYAAAIAEHFVTRLIVMTVEDPLLTAAMDLESGVPRYRPKGDLAKSQRNLWRSGHNRPTRWRR